jgi:hypothetical protein
MINQKELHKPTSEMFEDVIAGTEGNGDISIRELLELFGEKSFGLAILLFALPNCLPIPNVLAYSALTGIPIILLAIQMVFGRSTPWLPHIVTSRRFSRAKITMLLRKLLPYVHKIEHTPYPDLFCIGPNVTKRLVGIVVLVLGIILSLPIPFGNLLPGFAISFIAIGLMKQNRVMMAAGILFGVIVCLAVVTTLTAIITSVIGRVF